MNLSHGAAPWLICFVPVRAQGTPAHPGLLAGAAPLIRRRLRKLKNQKTTPQDGVVFLLVMRGLFLYNTLAVPSRREQYESDNLYAVLI